MIAISKSVILWALCICIVMACGPTLPSEVQIAYENLDHNPDFNLDIRPILSDRCFPCHGPDKGKLEAGLRLDIEHIAKAKLSEHPSLRAIVAGRPGQSELVRRILIEDSELAMPPSESKLKLSSEEKAKLIKWIEGGAEYKRHWAFIPPVKTDVPANQHPVDYLIKKRLRSRSLEMNDEADKQILLRRLALDLTGLPPSLDEMDDFLSDQSSHAYETIVDKLLANVHFGERMAADWLDVARYADTHGYTVDRYRDVSPYRDWVISSFNQNMPYDQFVTWQLAGDLLPEAKKSQKIATAFLRMHPQNMEGGIVPEEFRVEYVADRTNTFATAFMGMTMACAKCHDHKFDPLSQKEYYELYSFFNNINEAGQISFNNAMPVPTLLLTDEKQDSIIEYLSVEVKKEQRRIGHLEDSLQESAKKWIDDQAFHKLKMADFKSRAAGHYPLDGHLKNVVNRKIEGKMARTNSSDEKPVFSEGYQGRGLLLDGDAWLDLGGVGAFDRFEPFSVSLFLKLPKDLKDGVILHRGIGAVLYNFRGFHLALKDRKLEVLMAHTAPDNAILRIVDQEIPRDEWMHLVLKYDGSGRAQGLAVYLNGSELEARTETDNLYKTLNFTTDRKNEPGIQIGARWRGKGIGGAVVDDISVFSRSLTDLEILSLYNPQRVRDLLGKKSGELNADERRLLTSYFIQIHPSTINEVKRVYSLRQQLCHYTDTLNELMVFKEMEHRRPAFILDRGQYDSYKEEVLPRTPMAILAIDTSSVQPDRLDLAHWLFNDRHPLTARVFVNRIWQQFFGQGLVKTSEDFGNQGMMPSHPELLDYLAVYFRECDWDIKALIKLIVTSETYRQSSVASLHKREVDPENILLSRGPSKRLSAEMIRDQALAASGLLNEKIGGPSVFPYQPEGLWKVNGATYRESEGADLYRRSLYTIWKRSVPHPTQSTFDAPDRSECTMRRQQTNTPLQALVLMNDPIYIEASVALGRQIETDHNFDHVFRKLTGRKASVMENEALDKLWQDTFTAFSEDPDRCQGWLNKAGKMTEQDIMLAANSVVASTILNSDASIYKR